MTMTNYYGQDAVCLNFERRDHAFKFGQACLNLVSFQDPTRDNKDIFEPSSMSLCDIIVCGVSMKNCQDIL